MGFLPVWGITRTPKPSRHRDGMIVGWLFKEIGDGKQFETGCDIFGSACDEWSGLAVGDGFWMV